MAQSISFSSIPQSNREPFYFVEFDPSNTGVAGNALQNSLLIGQTVNAQPMVPTYIPSPQFAANLFGSGSQLAIMAAAYYAGDPEGTLWALPLPDASGSAAATGSFAFAGPATANGTLFLMVAGREVQVGVLSGQTATQIASNAAAAIGSYLDPNGMALPVTAAAATGTVTVTARNKGAVGNSIPLALNFYGSAGGEATPAGVTVTVTQMSGGATDPDLGSTGLSPPSAPTSTPSSSGGTLASGTIYGKVTYVTATGETLGSAEATATITGPTGSLSVTSPGASPGAVDWNFYAASAAGAETKQNAAPTAIGTPFLLTALTTNGGAAPTVNTATTGVVAALGTTAYDFIMVAGYTETTQLNELQALMAARWAYNQQIYGHVFNAAQSAVASGSDLLTLGGARNDPHMTMIGYESGLPNTPFELAASEAGGFAQASKADPARPAQTLPCPLIIAPPLASRFGFNTRNTMLYTGIALLRYHNDNSCAIDRAITTYQQNAWGQPDASYLDAETLYTLMYYVRQQRANLTQKFPRCKLAQDSTNFGSQGNFGIDTPSIVTPSIIKAELIAQYTRMCPGGDLITIVQDPTTYAANLVVQINGANPNRVDILDDPILVGGLRMIAVVNQFRLIDPPALAA